MKNGLNKIYSCSKSLLIYFIAIIVFEVGKNITNFAQEFKNIHWMIFAMSMLILALLVTLFILNKKNKHKAARVMVSLIFFFQTISTAAYTFFSFPKTPTDTPTAFIFGILYTATLISLFITGLVLHTNLSKERNETTLFAFQIIGMIMLLLTLINVIFEIVMLGMNGFNSVVLINFFDYLSIGITSAFIINYETLSLDKASIEKTQKQK